MDKSVIIENFNILWNRHCNKIYAFCYTKLENPTDIEDCIHNAFSALFIKMLYGDIIVSPEAWLYGCVKNQAYKLNESAKREIPGYGKGSISINDLVIHYDDYFVDEKSEDEIEASKAKILKKLSEDEQALLNNVYVQRMKICEIAKKSNIKPNTLSHRLCRLKKKILNYIYETNYY